MSTHLSPRLHYLWILPLCAINNTPILFKYAFDILRDIINASAYYVECVAGDVCSMVNTYCGEEPIEQVESESDSNSVTTTEEEVSESEDKKNV